MLGHLRRRRTRTTILSLLLLCSIPLAAIEPTPPVEPEIVSLFPVGDRRGSTVKLEIRGTALDGAYAVLFEGKGIRARIDRVEQIKEPAADGGHAPGAKKTEKEIRVVVEAHIDAATEPGNRWLRVVTPRGVTNRLQFRVNVDPVIRESDTPHSRADQAQVISYPVVVNGRISTSGEVDFYRFQVPEACELAFEVTPSRAALARRFRPEIAVFAKRASFFDPDRLIRLAFTDRARGEKVTMETDPRERAGSRVSLNYLVPEAGHYLVGVGSMRGRAAPHFVYQLRVVPADQALPVEVGPEDWKERSFTRKLGVDRLQELWARGLRRPIPAASVDGTAAAHSSGQQSLDPDRIAEKLSDPDTVLEIIDEREPNGELSEALEVTVPGIVSGVVQEPGDVDVFKFKVSSGQKLAFEVETPATAQPDFNPLLEIVDASGSEHLTNLQRTKEFTKSTDPYLISIDPKVIGTFEKSGDYYLRVREVTRRKGAQDFAYRLLIRPQIPHVGDTVLETRTRGSEDGRSDPLRINLMAGQARKLTLILDHEEGFFTPSNQIAVTVDGLPEGVELFPATSRYQGPGQPDPPEILGPTNHLPTSEKVAVVLHAREDASVTMLPAWITVNARPLVGGIPGAKLTVKRIPLMVLGTEAAEGSPSRSTRRPSTGQR